MIGHQTGCGKHQSVATSTAMVTKTLRSGPKAREKCSYWTAPGRSPVGADRAGHVFHPSNDDISPTQFRLRKDRCGPVPHYPVKWFRWLRGRCPTVSVCAALTILRCGRRNGSPSVAFLHAPLGVTPYTSIHSPIIDAIRRDPRHVHVRSRVRVAIRQYPEMSQESLKVAMYEEHLFELSPPLQSCVKCR